MSNEHWMLVASSLAWIVFQWWIFLFYIFCAKYWKINWRILRKKKWLPRLYVVCTAQESLRQEYSVKWSLICSIYFSLFLIPSLSSLITFCCYFTYHYSLQLHSNHLFFLNRLCHTHEKFDVACNVIIANCCYYQWSW